VDKDSANDSVEISAAFRRESKSIGGAIFGVARLKTTIKAEK